MPDQARRGSVAEVAAAAGGAPSRRPTEGDGQLPRCAGLLLHPTSVPGPDGPGDLGATARDLVTFLARAGQRVWQILPLHPPANDAMSPYDAASAFAGNTLLLALDDLVELDLLARREVDQARADHAVAAPVAGGMVAGRPGGVDPLAHLAAWKRPLLARAAERLLQRPSHDALSAQLAAFCERERDWLDDHVAFTQLRSFHDGAPRDEWPVGDRTRATCVDGAAASAGVLDHDLARTPEAALQFLFELQVGRLRDHAAAHRVQLLGDAPIYVGADSADVWADPELFLLDEEHRPAVRTGAPSDAMDPGGQVWPMPAYDWAASAATGHAWWMRRLRRGFALADIVRVDHFRAFADWWRVELDEHRRPTGGSWQPGPGAEFFEQVRRELGDVPLVVEDLGAVTDALRRLRAQTGLPQMRVLVQGLDEGPGTEHWPGSWSGSEAGYTHTHDFDTIAGWAARADTERLERALAFTGAHDVDDLPRAAIDTLLASPARLAIVPLQDWLVLGSEHRMNVPGTEHGNWRWVAPPGCLDEELARRMRAMTAARRHDSIR